MAVNHQVKQGDCISSIAYENGFFPETIWDHPKNAGLKELRKDPNVLVPNDTVFVPDKQIKEVAEPTNQVHKYQLKNAPAVFSVQLFDFLEKPRANQFFEMKIDDKFERSGTTTSEGIAEISLPPNAKRGVMTVGEDSETIEFHFGYLESSDNVRGMQARLQNIGFECAVDGKLDEEMTEVLKSFQRRFDLPLTGKSDSKTLEKLEEIHDHINEFPDSDNSNSQSGGGANQSQEVDETKGDFPGDGADTEVDYESENESKE